MICQNFEFFDENREDRENFLARSHNEVFFSYVELQEYLKAII